jgi:hypothetical protein
MKTKNVVIKKVLIKITANGQGFLLPQSGTSRGDILCYISLGLSLAKDRKLMAYSKAHP